MSTMAVSSEGLRSTLNPNAPVFIPAALRQVEEFSPEWYELVKTSPWFREHWYSQQQQEGTYGGECEDDVVNMLPDSFDVAINDELSHLEELDEAIFQQAFVSSEDSVPYASKDGKFKTGTGSLLNNLNLKSPKNYDMKNLTEAAKYREKPAQAISPKPSSRRIIQQPR